MSRIGYPRLLLLLLLLHQVGATSGVRAHRRERISRQHKADRQVLPPRPCEIKTRQTRSCGEVHFNGELSVSKGDDGKIADMCVCIRCMLYTCDPADAGKFYRAALYGAAHKALKTRGCPRMIFGRGRAHRVESDKDTRMRCVSR